MEDRIYGIIASVMEVGKDEINAGSSPENIASWDSLKHMQLILALEEEFGIELELDTIMQINNAGNICSELKKLTS